MSPSGNVDPDPSWGHPTKVSKEDDSSTSFVLYLIVDCIYCRCTLYSEEVCFPAQTMQTTWGNITSIHLALSHCHDLWIPIDSESIAWEDIRTPWIDTSVLPQAHRSSSCNLAGSEEGVCCGMTASISCVFLDFKGHSDPWNYRQKTRSQTQNKLRSFPVSDTTTLNDCRRASDENSLHEIASRNENVVPRHLTSWTPASAATSVYFCMIQSSKVLRFQLLKLVFASLTWNSPASKQSTSICHTLRHPSLYSGSSEMMTHLCLVNLVLWGKMNASNNNSLFIPCIYV